MSRDCEDPEYIFCRLRLWIVANNGLYGFFVNCVNWDVCGHIDCEGMSMSKGSTTSFLAIQNMLGALSL